MHTTHTIIWRFTVKPERIADFERHYGAEGTWAALFKRASGYRGTALLRDTLQTNVYVTIDRWESAESFAAAKGSEYAKLDAECADLTLREELLAAVTSVDAPA